ncbi:phosphatase 2C-like domain-containing protein [Polychytrium aggregatum]|uniref:phosphatase 2C-like domain-containing protein n=1 Tax=Polychytrium aggregatum TaxID=110093 RepID=UPI0022FDEE1F|nr:phosphatase 2C-like domain-containing protein [Polychytrium aggregatum]KAI9209109.1 phosphatase 2C-like domain-containing protein [Polychytrium aggregatum]
MDATDHSLLPASDVVSATNAHADVHPGASANATSSTTKCDSALHESMLETPDGVPELETDPIDYAAEEAEAALRSGFRIGFSEDRNRRYRRTMEDAHSYFYNFEEIEAQGWFAVFDGHAGKAAAEWCGNNLHETFAGILQSQPARTVPELMNEAFVETDKQLGERKGMFSGCTAVVGFVRLEDDRAVDSTPSTNTTPGQPADSLPVGETKPPRRRRVLYTANVGDARAVLCRNGVAVRLSYDHKGSDQNEARRVVETGGFVMNNRVNGVLAVTRSLGDLAMKEWVLGNPYTTETVLDDDDTFLILACDGVWDVCTDQEAVDLIKDIAEPQQAAENLLDHALAQFSTDNLSVLVIRFDKNTYE